MDPADRQYFDELLDAEVAALPPKLHHLIERVPLIVEDHPSDDVIAEFGLEHRDELCGLHDGIPLTDRSVEAGEIGLPEHVMIYREGILSQASEAGLDADGYVNDDELRRQIRITILHEIGHHFGLDEDDLAQLGYD